jgi:hypothetical protein
VASDGLATLTRTRLAPGAVVRSGPATATATATVGGGGTETVPVEGGSTATG